MRIVKTARIRARHERATCILYCSRRSKAHGGRGKAAGTCDDGVVEGLGLWEWEDGSRGVVALTGDGKEGDMVHAVFGVLVLWVGGGVGEGEGSRGAEKKEERSMPMP